MTLMNFGPARLGLLYPANRNKPAHGSKMQSVCWKTGQGKTGFLLNADAKNNTGREKIRVVGPCDP